VHEETEGDVVRLGFLEYLLMLMGHRPYSPLLVREKLLTGRTCPVYCARHGRFDCGEGG
jgi:hypothetical protein